MTIMTVRKGRLLSQVTISTSHETRSRDIRRLAVVVLPDFSQAYCLLEMEVGSSVLVYFLQIIQILTACYYLENNLHLRLGSVMLM